MKFHTENVKTEPFGITQSKSLRDSKLNNRLEVDSVVMQIFRPNNQVKKFNHMKK